MGATTVSHGGSHSLDNYFFVSEWHYPSSLGSVLVQNRGVAIEKV